MTTLDVTPRDAPLAALLPPAGEALAPDAVLDRFVLVGATGLTLYAHQEEAILQLLDERHLVLNTPTAASLVATFLHFQAMAAEALVLHLSDQGARQREVLRPLPASSAPTTSG